MVKYRIAPNFKWYFLDKDGKPAAGGKMYTRKSTDPSTPKPVFADSSGLIPYNNPIVFDASGGLPVPLYWEDDGVDLYWVQVQDKDGNILETMPNFPQDGGGGVTPVTNNIDIENHIINGQFNFIDAKDDASSLINNVTSPAGGIRVAPASGYFKDTEGNYDSEYSGRKSGWLFFKIGGSGISDSIKFEPVTNIGLGLPDTPSANAPRFFSYEATSAGDPVTQLTLEQYIPSVRTFSGEQVTLSFETKGTSGAPAIVSFYQNFGTGGIPSAPVPNDVNINYSNGVWARQSLVFTVPSIASKSLGTNNDDFFSLRIGFPLNTIGKFSVANIQLQRGNFGTPAFIYQTYSQTQYKVLIDLLSRGTIPPISRTGDIKFSMDSNASEGWIVVNDDNDTIGSAASLASPFNRDDAFNLFSLIWGAYDDAKAPVSGGRGATAAIDWAANKTIRFPQYIGRVIAGAGTGLGLPTHNIGDALGAETVALSVAELPPHNHLFGFEQAESDGSGDIRFVPKNAGDPSIANNFTTTSTGSGTPHENMQPTNYLYLHVKL